MKILFITLFSLFVVFTPVYTQNWTYPYDKLVEIELKELKISNDLFLTALDSLIFNGTCPNLQDETYKYLLVDIKKDISVPPSFLMIYVCLLKLPHVSDPIGYFEYKDYIFLVSGVRSSNLFKKGTATKQFSYCKGEITIIEEYPFWLLSYLDGRFELVESDCW